MKIFLTLFFVVQSFILLHAQESIMQKEVGVTLSNFNSFGLTYRTGTATSLWRFTAITVTGSNQKSEDIPYYITETLNKSINLSVAIGKEFRKNVTEKFELRYGADLKLGYFNYEREYISSPNTFTSRYVNRSITYGFNLVAGTNYVVSKNFVIGIELLPFFGFNNGSSERTEQVGITDPVKSDTSGFNYGISNSSAMLSLVYRW